MSTPSDSSGFSRARRALLGLGGIGLITGVASYLGLRNSGDKPPHAAPPEPLATTDKPQPELSSAEEQLSTPQNESELVSAKFRPHLKSQFTIHSESGTNACKLVEISEEKHQKTPQGTWASFLLCFEAPAGFLRDGEICRVTHPQLGEMELFLSSIGDPKKKPLLQAAFTQRI